MSRKLQPQQEQLMEEVNQLEMVSMNMVRKLKRMSGPDGRNLALSQTHLEDAFMRMRRSITDGQQDPGFQAESN